MPDPPPRAAHSGTGSAGDGFRGIGGDLLRTFPPLTPPPPARPAIDPTAPAFAVYGAHLLGAIVPGPDGARVSPCPVCRHDAVLPSAGGWIPIRCPECGTEFVATDGSPPPAPAKPPPPPPPDAGLLRRNLERWVASGEPDRWVAYRKGGWGETDFAELLESLRFTAFWPLDPEAVREELTAARLRDLTPSAPRSVPAYGGDWSWHARCPVCARKAVIPMGEMGEVRLTCRGCGARFVVEVARRSPPPSDAESFLDAFRASRALRCCLVPLFAPCVLGVVLLALENFLRLMLGVR